MSEAAKEMVTIYRVKREFNGIHKLFSAQVIEKPNAWYFVNTNLSGFGYVARLDKSLAFPDPESAIRAAIEQNQ